MVDASADVIALATADKLSAGSPYVVAPVGELTHIVAEAAAPDELLEPYRAARRQRDPRMTAALGHHRRLRRQRRRDRHLGRADPVGAGALRPLQERDGARARRDGPRGHPRLPARRPGDRAPRLGADRLGRRDRLRARGQPAGARSAPAARRARAGRARRRERDPGRGDEQPRREGREGPGPADHVLAARRLGVRRHGRGGVRGGVRRARARPADHRGDQLAADALPARRDRQPDRPRLGRRGRGDAGLHPAVARRRAAGRPVPARDGDRGRDGRLGRPLPAPATSARARRSRRSRTRSSPPA